MSDEATTRLTDLLDGVKPGRRDLLKRLLIGTGALAVLAPASRLLAAQDGQGPDQGGGRGRGKGKGKGKGKGNGKGKGKGKGTGRRTSSD